MPGLVTLTTSTCTRCVCATAVAFWCNLPKLWPAEMRTPSLLLGPQVCDQPHPEAIKSMVTSCLNEDFRAAYGYLVSLWQQGALARALIAVCLGTSS